MQQTQSYSPAPPVSQKRGTNVRGRASRAQYNASPNHCQNCQAPILARPGEKLAETRKRKFCGRSCAASFNNRLDVAPKKKPRTLPCAHCGAPLDPAARRTDLTSCSSCADAYLSRLGQQLKSRSASADIRTHMRQALAERPQQCQHCGYSVHVEPIHLRPLEDFPDTAPLRDINAPDNLAYLCPNCRWEYGHGEWGREGIAPVSGTTPAFIRTTAPHTTQQRPARHNGPAASSLGR